MSRNKISPEQQKSIRDCAKSELRRLETIQANPETVELLDAFKNKFNVCESVYKVVLREHQRNKGKKHLGFLNVTMQQAPYALDFAGYVFDRELLNELFGAKGKRGTTVKKLRDAVTHGIDEKAVREITNRKDELFGYMDAFLDTIRCFDQTAA